MKTTYISRVKNIEEYLYWEGVGFYETRFFPKETALDVAVYLTQLESKFVGNTGNHIRNVWLLAPYGEEF